MPICPTCRRRFDDSGFCPHDGTPLVADTQVRGPEPAPADKPARVIEVRSGALPPRQRENIYDRMIGKTFESRYLIEARLGEGGMGVVFRARHVVIEKPVAIKVLKREVARDQSVVRRFVQEARAASRIGHPNIVDVTDFGVTPDGMTYQVMEYIEGETLSAAMKAERPMPAARALPIVAQLCRALGAAHDKGIVHRDLKPENVFLISRDGRRDFVKVVDFGIAKVQPAPGAEGSPRLTRAGTVFGTPEYMAPEQAQGKGDTDQRVDVYALGTILYEMLTGTVPHRGESAMRTLAMQLMDPIVPPRELRPGLAISDGLEAVVMRALAKNRDQRYPSMQAMLEDLTAVAGGVAIDQPLSPSAEVDDEPADTVPEGALVMNDAASTLSMGAPDPAAVEPLGPSGLAAVPRPMPVDPSGGAAAEQPARRGWTLALVAVVLLAGLAAAVILVHGRISRREGDEAGRLAQAAETAGDGGPARSRAVRSGGEELDGVAAAAAAAAADAGPEVAVDSASHQAAATGRQSHHAHATETHATDTRPNHTDATETHATKTHTAAIESHTSATETHTHSTSVAREHPDAGPHAHTAPVHLGPPVEVEIITEPRGGELVTEGTYGGSDGTHFSRPQGTVLIIGCKQQTRAGKVLAQGRVSVHFDGTTHVVVCHMRPKGKCVEGLKNPLDDCPD